MFSAFSSGWSSERSPGWFLAFCLAVSVAGPQARSILGSVSAGLAGCLALLLDGLPFGRLAGGLDDRLRGSLGVAWLVVWQVVWLVL